MRQVGFICAAAFVALQENLGKLEGDHKKAKVLAGELLVYLIIYAKLFGLEEQSLLFSGAFHP